MMSSRDLPPSTSGMGAALYKQYRVKPRHPPKNTDLSNKTVIITGGNTGLGFESARQFLSFKVSHLIITARTEERGAAALSKLQDEFPEATIQIWSLEMSSYDSIQTFVSRVRTELNRLDIVVLNAGLSKFSFSTLPSTGHEEVMQVNYLSTALLTILLLPVLKSKSPHGIPGRLSIVNSGNSLFSTWLDNHPSPILKSFDDVRTAPIPGLNGGYGTSKLLAHLFIYKLVDYVSADDVVVNLVDPGLTTGTSLGRELPKAIRMVMTPFMKGVARSVSDGALAYLDATIVKGKESHGCFLADWEIQPFARVIYSKEGRGTIERLWQETLDEFAFVDARGILESMRKP